MDEWPGEGSVAAKDRFRSGGSHYPDDDLSRGFDARPGRTAIHGRESSSTFHPTGTDQPLFETGFSTGTDIA